MVPDAITNYDNISWDYMSSEGGLRYYPYKKINYLEYDDSVDMGNFTIAKPYNSVNGYVPRNNKLFTIRYL